MAPIASSLLVACLTMIVAFAAGAFFSAQFGFLLGAILEGILVGAAVWSIVRAHVSSVSR